MNEPTPPKTSEMQAPEDAKTLVTTRAGAPRDEFNAWEPRLLQKIDELVRSAASAGASENNADLVREMIVTSLKAHNSNLDRGDIKILNRALRELRYGFRIFKPYRERRKVTIFGSARTKPSDPEYKMTKAFAKRMATLELTWWGVTYRMLDDSEFAAMGMLDMRAALLACARHWRAFLASHADGVRKADHVTIAKSFEEMAKADEMLSRARMYVR